MHHDTHLYDLTIAGGHGASVVHTTANHLFWLPAKHAWTKASDLRSGDRLQTPDGSTAAVTGGASARVATGRMWDLTIPTDHDFYVVAGDTPLLVHNCGGLNDPWQVYDRVQDHVMQLHGYGTPASSAEGTLSKFGPDITQEDIVNAAMDGITADIYAGTGAAGSHYHLYDTGNPDFGTADGTTTPWVKIYVT